MNNDLISRTALKAVFAYECIGLCDCCKHIKHNPEGCALIDNAPAVDAEPVRHGRWENTYPNDIFDCYRCSCCMTGFGREWKYCPNCGARMDGGGGK